MKIIIEPGTCIDPVLKANRQFDTEFVLEPGDYYTRGCFNFPEHDLCMLADGQSLTGAASGKTRLILDTPVLEHNGKPTGYTEVLTGGLRTKPGISLGVRINGLTVDANSNGNVGIPLVGVHLWGADCVVRDVCVDNIWGYRKLPVPNEGFGIIINNPINAEGGTGNNVIEDCTVCMLGDAYACGVYMGCTEPTGVYRHPNRVTRTHVNGGHSSHAGFGVNCNTLLDDCSVQGVDRAVFCDTDSIRQVQVRNMTARDIKWALDLRAYKDETVIQDILVTGGFFLFRQDSPKDWAQAVLLEDNREKPVCGRIENVRFVGSTFRAGKTMASKGRITGHTDMPLFESCQWMGPATWDDVVDQSVKTGDKEAR